MIECISWIFTCVALYGTYLNINKDVRGFTYWIFSNAFFCSINFFNGHLAQGFLFGVYVILAVIGRKAWR